MDCEKVVAGLKERVGELENLLETLTVEPRKVGKVISKSHLMESLVKKDGKSKTETFYRVLMATGEEVCIPSLVKEPIENNSEVLVLAAGIEAVIPKNLERIVKEHTISLVEWNQVGGLKSQVKQIRDRVELPLKRPELFQKYGMQPINGILLYGEPGCGKTYVAKAIAQTILGSANVKEGAFIHLKGSDVLDKYVGESEKIISTVFWKARHYMAENKQRPVIFIDEAEAFLSSRSKRREHFTVVPAFLAEMDGIHTDKPLVILATNLPEQLDEAILREGRIDIKLHIGRPTQEDFEEMAEIHFKTKLCHQKPSNLAKIASQKVYASKALTGNVSGAMAQVLANLASNEAILRKVEGNGKSVEGIIEDDVESVINNLIESYEVGASWNK